MPSNPSSVSRERASKAANHALNAAQRFSETHQSTLSLPSRADLIRDPTYWQIEEGTYRTWRQQLEMGIKVYRSKCGADEYAKKALFEVETARKVAEQLGTDLPARETLIDDEGYWEVEEMAWKDWVFKMVKTEGKEDV